MRIAIVLGCFLAGCGSCAAEEDDVLKVLLAKSDYVLSGEIASDPKASEEEGGIVKYKLEFEVKSAPWVHKDWKEGIPSEKITLQISRVELGNGDKLSYFKKGERCILFIKVRKDAGEDLADTYLGVMPYGPSLVRHISTLSNAQKPKEK